MSQDSRLRSGQRTLKDLLTGAEASGSHLGDITLHDMLTRVQSTDANEVLLDLIMGLDVDEQFEDDERQRLIDDAKNKTGVYSPARLASLSTPSKKEQRQVTMCKLYLMQPRLVGIDFPGIKRWEVELKDAIDCIRTGSWSVDSFTLAFMALRRQLPAEEMLVTPKWGWGEITELFGSEELQPPNALTFLVIEDGIWKPARLVAIEGKWTDGLDDGYGEGGLSPGFAKHITNRLLENDIHEQDPWDSEFAKTDASSNKPTFTPALTHCRHWHRTDCSSWREWFV